MLSHIVTLVTDDRNRVRASAGAPGAHRGSPLTSSPGPRQKDAQAMMVRVCKEIAERVTGRHLHDAAK